MPTDPNNGRVTNAILQNNQNHIIAKLEKFEERADGGAKRVTLVEMKQAVQAEKILSISRVAGIRDGLITVGAIIGSALGIIIGPRQEYDSEL